MQVIYIGDNLRKYDLQKFRVYTEKPENVIQRLIAVNPLLEKLFVPVEKLGAALIEMKNPSSPLYIANKALSNA